MQEQLDRGATIEYLERSLKAPSSKEPEPIQENTEAEPEAKTEAEPEAEPVEETPQAPEVSRLGMEKQLSDLAARE